MHMMSKSDFVVEERDTIWTSKDDCTMITASGSISTTQASVHVRYSDMFTTVQLLEDPPAVLSLGKLCEEHAYSNEREGPSPTSTNNGRHQVQVGHVWDKSHFESLSTQVPDGTSGDRPPTASGDRVRYVPDFC